MSFQRFRKPTSTNIVYDGQYSNIAPDQLLLTGNKNKFLTNDINGDLVWSDIPIDLLEIAGSWNPNNALPTGSVGNVLIVVAQLGIYNIGDWVMYYNSTWNHIPMSSSNIHRVAKIQDSFGTDILHPDGLNPMQKVILDTNIDGNAKMLTNIKMKPTLGTFTCNLVISGTTLKSNASTKYALFADGMCEFQTYFYLPSSYYPTYSGYVQFSVPFPKSSSGDYGSGGVPRYTLSHNLYIGSVAYDVSGTYPNCVVLKNITGYQGILPSPVLYFLDQVNGTDVGYYLTIRYLTNQAD